MNEKLCFGILGFKKSIVLIGDCSSLFRVTWTRSAWKSNKSWQQLFISSSNSSSYSSSLTGRPRGIVLVITLLVWTSCCHFASEEILWILRIVNICFWLRFVFQVQWAGYDAFDEQVDVSARYRVHVGHAYLSFTRYVLDWNRLGMCIHRLHTVVNDSKIARFHFNVGGEANLWDIMNPSTQGPTIEQLQKVRTIRRFSIEQLSTKVC